MRTACISRLLNPQLRNPRRKLLAPLTRKIVMPKQNFYAIQKGREVGVFLTWSDCEERITGYQGAVFKKFSTAAEAEAFAKGEPYTTTTQKPPVPVENKTTSNKRTLTPSTNEDQSIVVYSDGACKGNGKEGSVAGIGVYWGTDDPRNIAERCPGDQTNNRAELFAIIRALETIPVNKQKIVIKTDSRYSINCIQKWLASWQENNFITATGEPVKNVGIIKYLSALKEARNERHQLVSLEYVPGHSGDPGNDGADAQANIGTTFEPRPDLDWGSLEARASETINALVYTTRPSPKPAVSPEASSERPSKIPKTSNPTTLAGSSMIDNSPKAPHAPVAAVIAPIPPPRSSLRPPTKRVDPKPTVYEKPQQRTVAVIPDPPIDFLLPSATGSKNPSLEPAPPRDFHNQSSLPQTSRFQSIPTPEPMKHSRIGSPLKASKVDAPLIPVSPSEIDFNIYNDCLLEGEEWEREIEDL